MAFRTTIRVPDLRNDPNICTGQKAIFNANLILAKNKWTACLKSDRTVRMPRATACRTFDRADSRPRQARWKSVIGGSVALVFVDTEDDRFLVVDPCFTLVGAFAFSPPYFRRRDSVGRLRALTPCARRTPASLSVAEDETCPE